MAQNKGRMTIDPNDPNYSYMANNLRNMFFTSGSDEVPSAPVPFMMDRLDAATRSALMNNAPLSPEQWATLQNMAGNQQANASANPDGTVSFNNWTYDDEIDWGGNLAMAAFGGALFAPALAAGAASGAGAGAAGLEAGALAGAPGYGTALNSSLAGIAGGAGATGGGMDWWTELGLTPADVGMEVSPWTTNPSMSDLTGGVLNNAGSFAGSGILETLKNIPTSLLKSLGATNPDGSVNSNGLMSLLGKLGAAGLGAYGSSQQANSFTDLANKYSEYGAPSRARFESSMTPGFDPTTIPGYSGALDTASKSILARLSATGGNPFGNPSGLVEANKSIVSGTALPAINEYQRLNANTGFGSSMNAAIPLETAAVGQEGNVLNSLGYGLNAVTNPQKSLTDIYKSLQLQGLA